MRACVEHVGMLAEPGVEPEGEPEEWYEGWCAEEESVDKVEWEDKVGKVEKQECSVDVEWK